jgi:hypothetical protein
VRARRAVLRVSLLGLLVGAIVSVGPASAAFAGKSVEGWLGSVSGAGIDAGPGGRLLAARDVAVVEATGDLYVVGISSRVERLDSDGAFELLWGRDVVKPGAPGDTGTGFEVCTVAADCKVGENGASPGEFNSPTGIAVNQVPGHPQEGHVYVRDSGNRRVQEFDADGGFVRAWGWGVATGAAAFEVCTTGCLQGLSGSGAGQFGTTSAVASLEVDPTTGNAYVADPANRRVQEFEGDGDFVSAFGAAGSGTGQFGSNQPLKVAVDSNGIVYATDSNSSNRVQRYDTTTDAFLAPIGGASPLLSGVTQGIEIDPTTGHLLLIRDPSSGETIVQELDTTTLTITDTHATGEAFGLLGPGGNVPTLEGIAVDGTRGRLYLPGAFRRFFPGGGNTVSYQGVYALDGDGANDPVASAGSPLSVDDDSAVLSGTVDPNGPTFYRFEYSKNGVDWKLVTGEDPTIGNASFVADTWIGGSSPQPVTATIEGLESNTVYRARIVATKLTAATSFATTLSAEATFLTDATPPAATTSPVHSHTDTSAWLSGRVNPKGSATSYRFEWGKSTTYENQAPASAASAGAGGIEKGVLEEITGLEPDTLYHYRLVAESAQGATAGEDRTFRTRPAFDGFAQRAFEQVTPVLKYTDGLQAAGGGPPQILGKDPGGFGFLLPVAADGGATLFAVMDALPDAEHGAASVGALRQEYRAVRGQDGWSSSPLLHRPPGKIDGSNPIVFGASPDLSRVIVRAWAPLFVGADQAGLYMREPGADLTALIAGVDVAEGQAASAAPDYAGGSEGLDRVFYSHPTTGSTPFAGQLHEWVGGSTRLVSVDPGGSPFAGPAVFGAGVESLGGAVSSDGEHAFFSAPMGAGIGAPIDQTSIYRRSGGASTVLASPSKRAAPDPLGTKAKVFQTASVDGDRVFFTSSELLTDDANTGPSRAGTDLYRYEVSTDTLVDISAESSDVDGARVMGVMGASESGDRVYYVARGQVVAGEGVAGQPNVYMWRDDGTPDGDTRYIATLAALDVDALGFNIHDLDLDRDRKPVHVTPDGGTLLFHSTASLTGYRNEGFSEVFVYEAAANGGEGLLSCVSCRANGTPAHGHSAVPRTGFGRVGNESSRALSVDGRRVFFNSADALLPADVNGELDVYEWEAGRLRLVSTGKSTSPSVFSGASASGDDVFFGTREGLVGQDRDVYMDLYDARVGGGFASQNPVEVSCVGDACRAAPSVAPLVFQPASGGVAGGEGDYVAPFRVAAVTAGQRRLLARRGRIALRVEVSRAGRVVVRALNGRRAVGSGSRTARRAGLVMVRLKLSGAARRALARRGRLRLRLEVRFAGEGQTATLDLRRTK